MSNSRSPSPIQLLIGIPIFVGAFFLVQHFRGARPTVAKSLAKAAEEASKTLPKQLDAQTRLDRVSTAEGRVFRYHYTLVEQGTDGFDADAFQNQHRARLVDNVRTQAAFKGFRDARVTVVFDYSAKDGTALTAIEVTPADYGG